MTGGAGIQPITIRAAGPVPSRVALASEQFSGLEPDATHFAAY